VPRSALHGFAASGRRLYAACVRGKGARGSVSPRRASLPSGGRVWRGIIEPIVFQARPGQLIIDHRNPSRIELPLSHTSNPATHTKPNIPIPTHLDLRRRTHYEEAIQRLQRRVRRKRTGVPSCLAVRVHGVRLSPDGRLYRPYSQRCQACILKGAKPADLPVLQPTEPLRHSDSRCRRRCASRLTRLSNNMLLPRVRSRVPFQ
jgi:hypothetical protein